MYKEHSQWEKDCLEVNHFFLPVSYTIPEPAHDVEIKKKKNPKHFSSSIWVCSGYHLLFQGEVREVELGRKEKLEN